MASISHDQLKNNQSGLYKICVIASQRAQELSEGIRPLVESPSRKVTSIALEEICEGKVWEGDPEKVAERVAAEAALKQDPQEAEADTQASDE